MWRGDEKETKLIKIPSLVIELNLSYIPMGNYHSESSFFNEFEPDLPTVDPTHTQAIDPEILFDDHRQKSDASTASIVSEDLSSPDQDWFNLARKLRGQNRELLDRIVKLEQELAESHVSEPTHQLQATQAQNSTLIEQIQASQQKTQYQQQEIECLQQQLTTVQETFAQLERECALLKEDCQHKTNQLAIAQRQVNELQVRLKRQQRYTLQYKAALDECLSNCARKIRPALMTASESPTKLDPKVVSIQPWSSQLETKSPSKPAVSDTSITQVSSVPDNSTVDPLDQTLEALFSVTTDVSDTMEDSVSGDQTSSTTQTSETQETQNRHVNVPKVQSSQSLVVNSPVPFSFSIDRSRKEEAAKANVDLPGFLRRN